MPIFYVNAVMSTATTDAYIVLPFSIIFLYLDDSVHKVTLDIVFAGILAKTISVPYPIGILFNICTS